MILVTPELRVILRANAEASLAARAADQPALEPLPVLKLFNPVGAATWIVTELYEDGDTLFGLADLGFGCPELGVFSLAEIASLRLPFGLRIERDLDFVTQYPISAWTVMAIESGSILAAERRLRRLANEFPSSGG